LRDLVTIDIWPFGLGNSILIKDHEINRSSKFENHNDCRYSSNGTK